MENRQTENAMSKQILESMFGHMTGGIERYINEGIPPGDFLTAIITNDLKGAFAYADHRNAELVREYVIYFYNYAPAECWGSEEKVAAWINKKRGVNNGIR